MATPPRKLPNWAQQSLPRKLWALRALWRKFLRPIGLLKRPAPALYWPRAQPVAAQSEGMLR
jgi:hypothetical protein